MKHFQWNGGCAHLTEIDSSMGGEKQQRATLTGHFAIKESTEMVLKLKKNVGVKEVLCLWGFFKVILNY